MSSISVNSHLSHRMRHKQRGMSLIESIVALVILAIGVMGLLGVQLRTLTDQQQGVQRATAMRLADELFEKVKANPGNAFNMAAPLGAAQWAWMGNYALVWGAAPANNPDCTANACTGLQRAQFDIRQWRLRLTNALPGSDAQVSVSPDNPRQLIAIIGWPLKESGADAGLLTPFAINIPNVATPAACGTTHMCYVAYGQP